MTGLQDRNEEMFNSIRSITGIDRDIIKAVFDGLYIAHLQEISTRGGGLYVPNIGTIRVSRDVNDENFYTFKPLYDADYAIKQAREGKIVSFREILMSIINTQIKLDNEDILDMLLTKDEMIDLGIFD